MSMQHRADIGTTLIPYRCRSDVAPTLNASHGWDTFVTPSLWVIVFQRTLWPGPEVIKLFSCSTQLSTELILLINIKMPTIVGIFTFISIIITTSKRLKARNSLCVDILVFINSWNFVLSSVEHEKSLITSRPVLRTCSKYIIILWFWPPSYIYYCKMQFSHFSDIVI